VETQLDRIRSVTSESVIEHCLESTLDVVETSIKTFCVKMSGEWLRDSRIREKIFLELNQVVNVNQLSMMAKYCMKSILIVENTSRDMSLTTFDSRIDLVKAQVLKLERFVISLGDVQRQWFYLLHLVKFSPRGEIDRDSMRLYNNCTEDLKRIDLVLQQRSENLLQVFNGTLESELNTDNLRSSLSVIMDDAHSYVQSMLESCPRLSLISYNRLVVLCKTWLLGPQQALGFVSECFHDLFEGVGTLNAAVHVVQRLFMCTGFVCVDRVETVPFAEHISFTLPLDEFVQKFNIALRTAMSSGCDALMHHRISCMQALLTDRPAHAVLSNIASVFQLRVAQLWAQFADHIPNCAYYLLSSVSFAEDVWTALGRPTGALIIPRDDLSIELALFAASWRSSLALISKDCTENIAHMQEMLVSEKKFSRMKLRKSQAALSSLLLLEISFLRTVEDLLACKCLESAVEQWAGRYQLRFQFKKSDRHNLSPVEVLLGSLDIPYGLEYTGGHVTVVPNLQMEVALQKALSSAFANRGSVFISFDSQNAFFESSGSLLSFSAHVVWLAIICWIFVLVLRVSFEILLPFFQWFN
jgi:hypothetical protein